MKGLAERLRLEAEEAGIPIDPKRCFITMQTRRKDDHYELSISLHSPEPPAMRTASISTLLFTRDVDVYLARKADDFKNEFGIGVEVYKI